MILKEGIIICNNHFKEYFLRQLSNDKFYNYKFISLNDFKKEINFKISPLALIKVKNKYDLNYESAKAYLDNIYFIEDRLYNNPKLDSLVSIKKFLEKENLIEKSNLFKLKMKNENITFIDVVKSKENLKFINEVKKIALNVDVMETQNEQYILNNVYEFENINFELRFVFNKIIDLLKKGINPSFIHLVNGNQEYDTYLKRFEKTYNIGINYSSTKSLITTNFYHEILNNINEVLTFKNLIDSLDKYKKYFGYKAFIDMINIYDLSLKKPSEYKDLIEYTMKNTKFMKTVYSNSINQSSIDDAFLKEDYVFYLGFNQENTPKVIKDEGLLNNIEFEILGLDTTHEINKLTKDFFIKKLKSIPNLIISYKLNSNFRSYNPSSLIEDLNLNVIRPQLEFGYSKIEESMKLATDIQEYENFNVVSNDLKKYNFKKIKYNEFDNKYKLINEEIFNTYFKYPVKLSYTTLKKFLMCPFSYYLDRILYLDEFKDNLAAKMGTFAHAILEESYNENFNFESSYQKNIVNASDEKERFYFNKISKIVNALIEFNKEKEELSRLKQNLLEQNINLTFDDGKLVFTGFIDKLRYDEIDGEIYCYIVDYKSGTDIVSLDNVSDGFNLQLPIYMFLLKTQKEIFSDKKINISGIYLQKISTLSLKTSKKSALEQLKDSFKLQGYTKADFKEISFIDPNFMNSDYIQGMKVSKDNKFYKYAKVINEDDMSKLIELSKTLIMEVYEKIKKREFNILPKKIEGNIESCKFCKNKDICFVKYDDFINLNKDKFFKEEEQ